MFPRELGIEQAWEPKTELFSNTSADVKAVVSKHTDENNRGLCLKILGKLLELHSFVLFCAVKAFEVHYELCSTVRSGAGCGRYTEEPNVI